MPPGLTTVRHTEEEGRELLRLFLFGGKLGPGRVPRGIDPGLVSEFIRGELRPDSEPDAYWKALETARFYERVDAVPQLMATLTGREGDEVALRRSAYALQAAGDLGPQRLTDLASDYFDRFLAPHAQAARIFPLLLETRLVLAPVGKLDRLLERLQEELDQAALRQYQDEASMMAYDQLAAVQRNDAARYQALIARKGELLKLPQADRVREWVALYMGRAAAFHPLLETWAGRHLRREVLEGNPGPVLAELEHELDTADPSLLGEPHTDAQVQRAAQAILYLGGRLSPAHQRLYAGVKEGTANFLWDDP